MSSWSTAGDAAVRTGLPKPEELQTGRGDMQAVMLGIGSENLYRGLVDGSGLVVFLFDREGRRVFVNDEGVRLIGKNREELLKGKFGDSLVPEERDVAREVFQRCVNTGNPVHGFQCRLSTSGGIRNTSSNLVPVRNDEGEIVGVQATVTDVTALVEAHEEVHRSGELYRSLVEAVGGVVIRLDRSGKRTSISDNAERAKGRSTDELLKGVLGDDMLPEDREAVLELLERVFHTGESAYGITTRQLIGGETRHILANWVPVFDEDGRVKEVQTTSMDITEQARMREQLRLYGARIRKVQEEERAAISQVLHDDTIQALTAVGHRIDALMAGHLELPKNVTSELELLANTVLDQTDALRRLCMGLRPAMLDRIGLGAAVEWLVRNACDGNGVKGTVRVDKDLERLNPNAEIRLFRIAQEAVNNAVRHAKAKNIEVSIGVRDGHLELEVKDDGIGFDSGTHPMEYLDSERLGLLGMRERAGILGADLDVQSEPGMGCRVFVRGSIEQMEASV